MDIDQDRKPHLSTEVPGTETKNVWENGMDSRCIVNCKESKATDDPPNVMIDIITYQSDKETTLVKAEDPDATEYSSSFADTISDADKFSGLSEAEVESQFFGDSEASPYDPFSSLFQMRKKKLTEHWRSFVRPLMWRCKWTELKLKQIESQALKYARELEACEQGKHSKIDYSSEVFCSKSLPFSNQCYRRKAKKRRKRRRAEDTTDPTSYMLHHSLFSYLENRRSNPESNFIIDDFGNTATEGQHANCKENSIDDDRLYGFGDGDNSLEQLLKKIEIVHARVQKLKNQLDTVISNNAAKFSSSENLSLLAFGDAQTSSAPSPTVSAGHGETISAGKIYAATQQISGYDIGDLVLPESTMSSYGEAIHVPDIIESTVGLLSAADVTFPQPQVGDSTEDILENVLIHNEASNGERDAFMETSLEVIDNPLNLIHNEVAGGECTNPCPITTSELDPMSKTTEPQGHSTTLKSYLASDLQFPRNKRKRAERKAGSGSWNKKCSGDPDSQ